VDAAMSRPHPALALLLVAGLLAAAIGVVPNLPGASAVAPAAASGSVHGNLTGPTVVGWKSNSAYSLHGTGGPAVLPNGTIVGNLTYYASVSGINTTGVSITPDSSGIVNGGNNTLTLSVNNVSQTLTILVELSSVLNQSNESTNFTYTVQVVQPYVVATTLVNFGNTTVLTFPVQVRLDGVAIASVSVPTILAHQTYDFSYSYATLGLSSGSHTFTLELLDEHGLVRFANGSTFYSVSFYIPPPPPDYEVWYVFGAVAFLGALLILSARVGARRRRAAKK
jgi:hypothetical protein